MMRSLTTFSREGMVWAPQCPGGSGKPFVEGATHFWVWFCLPGVPHHSEGFLLSPQPRQRSGSQGKPQEMQILFSNADTNHVACMLPKSNLPYELSTQSMRDGSGNEAFSHGASHILHAPQSRSTSQLCWPLITETNTTP